MTISTTPVSTRLTHRPIRQPGARGLRQNRPLTPRHPVARWLIAVAATLLPGSLLAMLGIPSLRHEHARQHLSRAARQLRGRDALTRLYDSAEFIAQSRREMVRTIDMQCPISLVLVDSANLAAVHRLHGAATVNRVLASVADICVSRLRGYDLIGRLDGQMIAILLPGADADRAAAVTRTLGSRISALSLDTPSAGAPLKVSVHFGVATRVGHDENLGLLIARARHSLAADQQQRTVHARSPS